MNKYALIIIILLTASCGRSLKNGWTNFSAYYNTFYNAKQDYRAGLSKVKKQPIQINPDQPVRPHPAPVPAGGEDFEQAIANAAQMLRRFSDSKWTDDALLLMGKSYYHQQEYFLAIQKFEEVLALPMRTPVKQKAVIWKGRAMLDIASYSVGISFLESRLEDNEQDWNPQNKAETQMVLAEHYAMIEQWSEAAPLLEAALLQINNENLKGRGYYLLGQLLQNEGDWGRAFQAYTNVKRNFPDYEYIYWAEIKRAEVSRLQGNAALAVSLYRSMLRDDKNAERRDEIYFQLGRTYETESKYREAESAYERVLRNPSPSASGTLLADTYYRMGRIYSEQYGNYEGAAAYFDSSSTQDRNQIRTNADSDNQTGRLATAYSNYTDLKNEISRIDSLLRLGSLSDDALEAELAGIRRQREELLQNSQNRVQQTNNLLVNTQEEIINESTVPEEGASVFGFLNYKDPQRVQSGRRQFAAVWGNRPLTDNWRRREALSGTSISGRRDAGEDAGTAAGQVDQTGNPLSGTDAAAIPRTAEAQNELKAERVNAQYQLGNLFFLSLDKADSAGIYYRRVLREKSISPKLRAQTLYSLYELSNLQQQPDSAASYESTILQEYPGSVFAKRIRGDGTGSGAEAGEEQSQNAYARLRTKFQQLMTNSGAGRNLPNSALADTLRTLAVNKRASRLAPYIYFEAIQIYIRYAKQDTAQNSADSLQTTVEKRPYSGERWMEVRRMLFEFEKLFPGAPQITRINTWRRVLGPPEE